MSTSTRHRPDCGPRWPSPPSAGEDRRDLAQAERTLRQVQSLLAPAQADPQQVLEALRAVMARAGYPPDPLCAVDPGLAAGFFSD